MMERVFDPYLVQHTNILANKAGLLTQTELDVFEFDAVITRCSSLYRELPRAQGTLKQFQWIHHYLFQDVYEWAGKIRKVDIAKWHFDWGLATKQINDQASIEAMATNDVTLLVEMFRTITKPLSQPLAAERQFSHLVNEQYRALANTARELSAKDYAALQVKYAYQRADHHNNAGSEQK